MGIFSRLSEIVNSNINAMLDKAEDPEKMVRLMIHEMEDTLTEVKSAAAEVVADKLRLTRAVKGEKDRAADWDRKAQLAVEKGREELARSAVEQKLACDNKIANLEKRLGEVEVLVGQYQEDIGRLENKLANARSRQRTLIASHKSAVNRKRVEEKIYKVNTTGAFARFEHYEKRIDRYNAEAEVIQHSNNSLEKKFEDLERSQDIDAELARIKEKMGHGEKGGKGSETAAKKENKAKEAAVS